MRTNSIGILFSERENMSTDITNQYRSTDFYLTACILASGYPLVKVVPTQTSKLEFVIATSPVEADKLIQKHWSRDLVLPSRSFVDAIKELKTRMYQQ